MAEKGVRMMETNEKDRVVEKGVRMMETNETGTDRKGERAG